jgi:hypothetical protein
MAQIKHRRLPDIDYPSGRGAGLPAAGVHAVDRKLGALPTSFKLQGASGQPSTSADSGYSRNTIQRVNKGYDNLKEIENVPEISWLKVHADQLDSMGLTPRVVVEMYHGLLNHKPRNETERRLISEMHGKVLSTRRKARAVTRLALLENVRRAPLNEGVMDVLKSAASEYLDLPTDTGDQEPSEDEQISSVTSRARDLSGGSVSRSDVERMMKEDDATTDVLACNSTSLEILQTALAVTGVFGDLGTFLGVPVGMVADLVNACINLVCGHYFHAMLDLIAVFPFAGDLVKIMYAKRYAKALGYVGDSVDFVKGVGSVSKQAEEASKVIDAALTDRLIGPKMSSIILKLKRMFGTAGAMAERLSGLLNKTVTRMINYLEDMKSSSDSGGIVKRGAVWILSKLPMDILSILKRIQDEGIPALKDFIVDLFGRKGAQKTASGAQLRDTVSDAGEGAEDSMTGDESEQEYKPGFAQAEDDSVDPDHDGIPGPFPDGVRSSSYVFEGKKRKTKGKSKISLTRALIDDPDAVFDEMSTVATSLGAPGEPGGGGYITPIHAPRRGAKTLEDLVPGYSFAKGSSIYYKH